MNKFIIAIIILFINSSVFSQIRYKKGSLTDNDGKVITCLILDEGWSNNPEKFTYKLSENGDPKAATVRSVSEFSVDGKKYERHTVEIDRSYPDSDGLSYSRAPKWNKEDLFLKVMVEGNETLYLYRKGNDVKFFYHSDNGEVKQLLYKEYKTMDEQISKNITYVNQLFKEVNCSQKSIDQLKNIDYSEKDLTAYFIEDNRCSDPDYNAGNATYKESRGDFNLKPSVGVAFSSLSVYNLEGSSDYNISFDQQTGLKLGLELEYIMPFNKNKWSIFLDMNYISYNAAFEKDIYKTVTTIHLMADADLKALQLPFGIRYYVFLNDDSKIYFDAGFNYAVFMDSKIFISGTGELDVESSKGMFGGIGYTLKNRYTLDLTYQNGDVLNSYLYRDSDFNVLSLSFKYTVF
jgi:outer membrane protein W